MPRANVIFDRFHMPNLPELVAAAILATGLFPACAVAQQPGQETFSSPEKASAAVFSAAQSNDEKALLDILGPGEKQIVSSGDETEDAQNRTNFVQKYQEMHRLVKEPDGTTTLYVGAANWPMPIPLVNKGASWYFDTDAGKREILYRRVGQNEMSAVRVCEELVAAEKEYYADHNNQYAQQISSDAGEQNGLYWQAAAGQALSPAGPMLAYADAQTLAKGRDTDPIPYRGYYYRILTAQGKTVRGGAKSYIINGKMTQGFALLAYPAEYRLSGVMTFVVSDDGEVYRKDLGSNTAALAIAMKNYDPGSGWQKDADQQEEPDGR